jgi:hypothetical protein
VFFLLNDRTPKLWMRQKHAWKPTPWFTSPWYPEFSRVVPNRVIFCSLLFNPSTRLRPPNWRPVHLAYQHQPAVLFSQNKSATSNQQTVLLSQNKSVSAISHQPNEQAVKCIPCLRHTSSVLLSLKLKVGDDGRIDLFWWKVTVEGWLMRWSNRVLGSSYRAKLLKSDK